MKLRGDRALRAQAARGDAAAFTGVYERHHQELYRYCRSILRHEEDARDALQNTMAKAFAALENEERDFELRPWLFRIAHNEAISLVRRRRPTCELEADILAGPRLVAEDAADRERLSHLRTDLNDLPDQQRIALVLRELNGLGHKEIAAVLECTPNYVKQTIFEARTALHEFEEGRAMACDEVQRTLSDSDGRVLRGRRMRAHLRSCPSCHRFRASLEQRPAVLAMLAPPLPLAASSMLLHHLLPGAKAAAAGGGASTAGVGGGVAAGVATKSLLAVAAAVVVVGGATAAPEPTRDGSRAAGPAATNAFAAVARPHKVRVPRTAVTRRADRHTAGGGAPRAGERPTPAGATPGPSSQLSAPAPDSGTAPDATPADLPHGGGQAPAGSGKPADPGHGRPAQTGKPSTPAPATADHGNSQAHKPGSTPQVVPPQAITPGALPPVATPNVGNGTPPSNPGLGENAAPGRAPTRQH